MGTDFVPTGIVAGSPGAIFSAPSVTTLDHGESYVIPAGVYWLYDTDADMDLEIVTDPVSPTWTKIRDGAGTDGMLICSDGTNLRLHNSHVSSDDEDASLIKVG